MRGIKQKQQKPFFIDLAQAKNEKKNDRDTQSSEYNSVSRC